MHTDHITVPVAIWFRLLLLICLSRRKPQILHIFAFGEGSIPSPPRFLRTDFQYSWPHRKGIRMEHTIYLFQCYGLVVCQCFTTLSFHQSRYFVLISGTSFRVLIFFEVLAVRTVYEDSPLGNGHSNRMNL